MALDRDLPSRQNPYTLSSRTPPHDQLVAERKLGRTRLPLSAGYSAVFDYVHLRVRLPTDDLSGSEVFRAKAGAPLPESYFLMRRSSDGNISATGLFKASFPYATKVEEQNELAHLKSVYSKGADEIAGNYWVTAEAAIALAADYNISAWINALLDPVRVAKPNHKDISEPPTFIMPASKKESSSDATRSPSKRTVSREMRSTSPVKSDATPADRPKASPKKRGRKPKKTAENAEVNDASKSLQDIIDSAPALADADAAASLEALDAPLAANTARVTVTSDVLDGADGEEIKHTNIKIDLPLDAEQQSLPTSPEQMAADAKAIVKDALELQQANNADEAPKKPASKRSRKRKASEAVADDEAATAVASKDKKGPEEVVEEVVPAESSSEPAAKRTRVMVPAEEYHREKMQRRALMGTAVAAGIGFAWTAFPYVAANISNLF